MLAVQRMLRRDLLPCFPKAGFQIVRFDHETVALCNLRLERKCVSREAIECRYIPHVLHVNGKTRSKEGAKSLK